MIKGTSELKAEIDEELDWDTNPVKRAIQKLFSHELSEESYRKVPVQEARNLIKLAIIAEKGLVAPYSRAANRLLKQVERAPTTAECVTILGTYLLRD